MLRCWSCCWWTLLSWFLCSICASLSHHLSFLPFLIVFACVPAKSSLNKCSLFVRELQLSITRVRAECKRIAHAVLRDSNESSSLNHSRTWKYLKKKKQLSCHMQNPSLSQELSAHLKFLACESSGPRGSRGAQLNPLFSSWQQQHPCTSLIRVGSVYYVLRIAKSSSPRHRVCSTASHSYSLALRFKKTWFTLKSWHILLPGHATKQAEL